MSPSPSARDPRGARLGNIWPLGLYLALALALFGVPVLGHLGTRIVASDPLDASAFMWFLAWWPHALLHGLNPFVTHAMFVPEGFNLTWAAALPGPSIVLSPITLAFGPAVSWNVIQLCSPALSAWTAFLLCRHVTGRVGPSLVGGYVFGFSGYVLIHLTGGPNLALVALLPVLVLLVVRRVDGSIAPRRFLVGMTLTLTAQYLTSSEVLATATLFGAIALALAYGLMAAQRPALVATCKLLAGAYAATAILISPFLLFFFFGHQYPPGAINFTADLASFVLPPELVALTRQGTPFRGAWTESYLGLPMIALIAAFAWSRRHDKTARLVVLSLLAAAICALGRHLVVRGDLTSIPGPWLLLSQLPILRYAIPVRLAVFATLPAALIVALWLSRVPTGTRARVARWGLALLAVAFIVPDVGSSAWDTRIQDPAFFASGAYRSYLKPSDRVLTIPAWGQNERWQADTGFHFALADGYAGNPFPASYSRYPTWNTLVTGQLTSDYAAQLRRFVRAKGVTAIVVDQTVPGPWTKLFGTLGVRPVSTGGVLVYRLRGTSTTAS
jgi:hypothetical protein